MQIKEKRICVVAIFLSISISLIIVATSFAIKQKSDEPKMWVLHSYGNNVALYNGDEIIEVYGSIQLDTLPEEDVKLLDNGISFLTRKEATAAIEDYDG